MLLFYMVIYFVQKLERLKYERGESFPEPNNYPGQSNK